MTKVATEHRNYLVGRACRYLNDEYQDAVQDAFVTVLSKPAKFDWGGDIRFALRSMAKTVMFQSLRIVRLHREYLPQYIPFGILDSICTEDEHPEVREHLERRLLEIAQRCPLCVEAFRLRKLENWSYEDITKKLGVSSGSIRSNVALCRKRLREIW